MDWINQVVHADCLEYMEKLPNDSVNMIFADLPYQKTACSWDILIPMESLWKLWKRILKKDSAIVLTATQPFTSLLVTSKLDWFKCEWIWKKPQGTNPLSAEYLPMKNHESVLVFSNGKCPYYPQKVYDKKPYSGFSTKNNKQIGEVYGSLKSTHRDNADGSRFPKTVISFKPETGLHPTQKPLRLVQYFLKTYSKENDMILDCCAGSGTTGVAAILTNRRFLCIEKDEKYYQVAKKRINGTVKTDLSRFM